MRKTCVCVFTRIFSLSLLLLTLFSVMQGCATLSWNIQTVDNDAYTLVSRSPIVLDSNNSPHFAYTNVRVEPDRFQTPLVIYANWNGSNWSTQQIAIGRAYSLVLDASDNPHILYCNSWEPLMYASLTGSNWNLQSVDPKYFTGGGFGIVALDSSGNPHVAYTDGTSIKYAVLKGSDWSLQKVATYEKGQIPFGLSFALDKNDTPYMMYSASSYADYSQPVGIRAINVTLATFQNSNWKIQPLSLPPPIGDYGNIVADSKGTLHTLFTQHHYVSSENKTTLSTLLYASWSGSGWNTQPVVSNIRLDSMSLALDTNDYPHISYVDSIYDEQQGDIYSLKYASWTGTTWETQTVDTSNYYTHALGPYLAVDSNNKPHISYLVQSVTATTSLRYAAIIETTQTPSATAPIPSVTFPPFITLTAATITIIVSTAIVVIYVWKRKTRPK